MCWGMSVAAHLVVIMGSQLYDGTGQGGNDYPVTDLLQMIGRASRPGVDDVGRYVFGWGLCVCVEIDGDCGCFFVLCLLIYLCVGVL